MAAGFFVPPGCAAVIEVRVSREPRDWPSYGPYPSASVFLVFKDRKNVSTFAVVDGFIVELLLKKILSSL